MLLATGGRQMRFLLAIAFTTITTIAHAQNCNMIGSSTFCDNGLSGNRMGNTTFWSDGTSSRIELYADGKQHVL